MNFIGTDRKLFIQELQSQQMSIQQSFSVLTDLTNSLKAIQAYLIYHPEQKQFEIKECEKENLETALEPFVKKINESIISFLMPPNRSVFFVSSHQTKSYYPIPQFTFEKEKINLKLVNWEFTSFENDDEKLSTEKIQSILFPHINSEIKLSSGKIVTKEDFLNDPLFQLTENKFSEIVYISKTPLFKTEYKSFLTNLQAENWFEQIELNPKKMAQLSIIAYLDEKIDQEELLVINIIAEGYTSVSKVISLTRSSIESGFGDIEEVAVDPFVISKDRLAVYLKNCNFPPFARSSLKNIIKTGKSEQELDQIKADIIEEFGKRSVIKRTVLEYTLTPFIGLNEAQANRRLAELLTVEMSILGLHSKLGFINSETKSSGTMVLLPPMFTIDLFCRVSTSGARSDHFFTFGYSDDDSEFYKGIRVVSIPSPAFKKLPYVHSYISGPRGLGILFHDINYHLALESNIPHVKVFIEIAKGLEALDFEGEIFKTNKPWEQFSLRVASLFIDREANGYRRKKPEEAFWGYINHEPFYLAEGLGCFKDRQKLISWFNLVYYPIVKKAIEDSYSPDDVRRKALVDSATYLQ